MRNACRPMGRFFCLLKWLAAAAVLAATVAAQTNGPAMTQVVDTVYRADGTVAKGTVLISWPPFTTSDGKAVAAGALSVQLGSGGAFAASLAPNTGAQPSGVYYKVIYQLAGQEPSTEYWVVPATGSTTIGAVRAKLQPPTIAAQVLTRDVAETNYVHVAGDQALSGVKTFTTPPSVPTPQNSSDAANKGYVDAVTAGSMASPGPIGSIQPNAATFTTVNKVINPTAYTGVDVGAQINAAIAANNCWYGQNLCIVQLPNGTYNYSTTITVPFGVTLQCGGQTTDFIHTTLNYTGTGTAIALTGSTSQLRNCGITAPRASVVIDNSGQSTTVDSIYFSGYSGGTFAGTIIRAHGDKQVYSNIQAELFSGIGFQCDHAIDVYLDKFNFYGTALNRTGISLLLETGCAGIHVSQFSGGNSGLHGLVVRNTMGGQNPIQLFFNDFISDCSYSDGWYFDPSLNGYELDAHFVNSWSAGAGLNCSNNSTLQAHKAGVRISGGSAINISNSMIRANSGSGVVIDNATGSNTSGIALGDNQILSNNRNNDGAESGIDVVRVVAGLSIHGNTITNSLEGGSGHQRYGMNIASDSTDVSVAGNNIFGNVSGDTSFAAGLTMEPVIAGSLAIGSTTVIDASRNATVQNLTVNGTCTGCGGGGGGGDLSSPPAIGSGTPNAGTFTTLTAQSVNGTLNAGAFPGADPCAKINNAVAALPSTGGVVDASGFTASQIGGGCATTINANVAAATLRFGAGTWKLGGNPGINVTAPKVTIECPKASEGDIYNTVAATLISNGAYPLIADTVQSLHGTDGPTVRNCYLDGNAVGTFGLFLPYGSSGHLENVYTRNFTSAGQFLLGGQWTMMAASSGANGGDGLVLGYDSAVDGNAQFAGNQGSAIHVVSGGNVLHGVGTYKNRLHGIYLDGRAVGDWTGQTAYVQQSFIRPGTGNAGDFVYFTQTVGTTGGTRPGFCQIPGCTFKDGSVTWINAGTGYGYVPGSIFEGAWWNFLESANSTSNGFQAPNGFDADDVRIEGTVEHPAFQNNVSAAMVRQSEANDYPAHGIHLINTNYATINNVQWLGAGHSNNPDLGGLRFEASKGNTVSNINCWFSYSNCIQLINANNSTFSGLNVVNNGLAGTPTAGTYALSIDAASVANTVNDLNVRDDRGPAYSRGVADAGMQTVISNYRKSNLAASPDSYGSGFVQEFSLGSAPTYNAGSGQGFSWKSGGAQTGQLDASGNWTVSGSLSARNIPGHEYFVSKYASIQAAIDAAYGSGVVSGKVIDDRAAAYSGAGFYVPDSVTVELAPVAYAFTGTVTRNNGNNNVTAAIVVEQGAHLAGRSTSSNHGTTIGVSSGFAGDIIATTSVGTGIGAKAQWWHWGSIENLNINGANQTSGRCLVVENMGETSRVENILARSCYGNNIEFIGASASQSSVRNITTGRSQTASGIRFTNLAGVGKIDGLSGDCNPASLVSVQENAAGSLTILGLKAEGETSICSGPVQDPVVLLDGVAGFNDHVRIIGGYAFGTSQASFAKFVNAGNAILETEGLYITGYTNMLNDTVRGVTVPLSSSTSKQPFYYEPGGTTYANQAFTLTGGTFVQGQPATTPTEIFGLTTGSATLLAAAGNGDNSSVLTGGIQISGQNRTTYGTPPEIMARWGYRWLGSGLGYDTTNFDLVPAWNSGDSSTRSLGNALTVCKKGSTTVSCRWPNIYALNVDTTALTLNGSAVTIPTAGSTTPNMDGTGAAGSSANFARADHVHPSDSSRVATASITAYGACGDSTHVCQVTTNSQGLVTNQTAVAIAAGSTNIPYWSNQVAAGSSIAMAATANKVYCYGIRIDQPITVSNVGMFVAVSDSTGYYSVQIFPQGNNQSPVFSSTAIHVSAAAGTEQQFSQTGNATWAATPGIYQLCTTGTAVTATVKGSASPMWNYYSQPSGLTSSGGLMSGTLSSTVAPTFGFAVPAVVMH